MAKKIKTEEDWFLRGGERPQETPPELPPDGDDADVVDCPHCGGEDLASEECCTHCGRPLYDGDDEDERDYVVTMTRTRTVCQRAKVRVRACSGSDAMEKAEVLAEDGQDQWSWEDDGDTEEFEDVEADDAEEADR